MIRVLGIPSTLAKLAATGARMAAATPPATKAVAEEVAEEAQRQGPGLTGETRDSIQVTEEGVSAAGAAIYLEFGTSKMDAQPFLRPAAEEADAEPATAIYRAALRGL